MWQRWFLWVLLAVLVSALLVTVVWLAGRHEAEQVQAALDRDTADAAADLRAGLQRNVQSLHAPAGPGLDPERWADRVAGADARPPRVAAPRMARPRRCARWGAADTPYRMRRCSSDDGRRGACSPTSR